MKAYMAILILLYLSCLVMSYLEVRHMYGKDGIQYGQPTETFDFVFCVTPLLNIAPASYFIGRQISKKKSTKKSKKKLNFNKFFRLNN